MNLLSIARPSGSSSSITYSLKEYKKSWVKSCVRRSTLENHVWGGQTRAGDTTTAQLLRARKLWGRKPINNKIQLPPLDSLAEGGKLRIYFLKKLLGLKSGLSPLTFADTLAGASGNVIWATVIKLVARHPCWQLTGGGRGGGDWRDCIINLFLLRAMISENRTQTQTMMLVITCFLVVNVQHIRLLATRSHKSTRTESELCSRSRPSSTNRRTAFNSEGNSFRDDWLKTNNKSELIVGL